MKSIAWAATPASDVSTPSLRIVNGTALPPTAIAALIESSVIAYSRHAGNRRAKSTVWANENGWAGVKACMRTEVRLVRVSCLSGLIRTEGRVRMPLDLRAWVPILSIALAILAWDLAVRFAGDTLLPGPWAVLRALG